MGCRLSRADDDGAMAHEHCDDEQHKRRKGNKKAGKAKKAKRHKTDNADRSADQPPLSSFDGCSSATDDSRNNVNGMFTHIGNTGAPVVSSSVVCNTQQNRPPIFSNFQERLANVAFSTSVEGQPPESQSQADFFRMLDEKIAQGREHDREEDSAS